MISYETLSAAYRANVRRLLDAPVVPSRNGASREILAVQFSIEDPSDLDVHCEGRRWSASYFAAEVLWYLSGTDRVAPIAAYAPKSWLPMSADGLTVRSAYGARLFAGSPSPFDRVAALLASDAASRRAVVPLLAAGDALDGPDVPCTTSLQFLLRGDRVHLVATMRSNDAWRGTAYDVPAFCVFQSLLASRLGAGVGRYVHQVGSLHLYDRDVHLADRVLGSGDAPCRAFAAPRWDVRQIACVIELERQIRERVHAQFGGCTTGFWLQLVNVLAEHWDRGAAG